MQRRKRSCYYNCQWTGRYGIAFLLEILAEAEEDVKNNRVAPMSDTFDDLRTMLQEG